MPFQQVGDINIYYELRGRGYPLILIQGFYGFVYSNELIISPSLVSSVAVVISRYEQTTSSIKFQVKGTPRKSAWQYPTRLFQGQV